MAKIRFSQVDYVATEFEGSGTDSRQTSIKGGGVTEGKLGFTFTTVEALSAAFSFDGTRSNYTLGSAASANANVTEFAVLTRDGVDDLTKVTTTAGVDEWSLSGTTLSVHGDITAGGNVYKLRYVVGSGSGPSTTSGNMIWMGLLPQVPLQTETDYFEGLTLDPKWTELDNDANQTVEVDADGLKLTRPSHAGTAFAGIFQAAPADSQFCITAEIRTESAMKNFSASGIFVAEDIVTNPTTDSLVAMSYTTQTSGPSINFQRLADYNSFSDNITAQTPYVPYSKFFARIYIDRDSGGTITPLMSLDGRNWALVADPITFAGGALANVDYIGIHTDNNGSGYPMVVRSRMFRVDVTTDPYLPVGGFVGTSVPSTVQHGPVPIEVSGGNTINQYGWTDRKLRLVKCEVFSAVPATVGAYTFALTKLTGGAFNMLSAATFDLASLTAFTPTSIPLTAIADDLILDTSEVWGIEVVSDNGALDAEGVYFSLTWLVL